ncbi:universal stress protein [Prauserella alba]|uniref:UspA domain-containing protein n=1 Tax=Prauserella alba TaxID=176898 RepID=A0ABN1VIU5_9PSEU|nr:universal stress protein [Prauserella alba]MCP2181966.1 Universal stress protein family protein [Prauserella alba]
MTVIVARTDTPESEAALSAGVAESRRRGEDLVVFNLDGVRLDPDDTVEGAPVSFEEPDPRDRDPVGSLLDTATRREASLIVIGLKRRSPTGKLLFGSMAQHVLLEANAPVLAVKAGAKPE